MKGVDKMGKILGAYLFPHPPIILEEIGKGEEKKANKTIEGVRALSRDIATKSPSTIILITPHGPLFRDAVSISIEETLKGDFGGFGHGDIILEFKNNIKLVKNIINNSLDEGIMVAEVDKSFAREYGVEAKLDHGALVPLYFVDKESKNYKLIHITYGLLSPKDLYKFGRAIEKSIVDLDEKVVIISSGDLSHKLSNEGPYSYSPYGKVFDEAIVNIIKSGNMEDIISFDLELAERAGECGLRSLMIMAGIVNKYKLKPEVLSYEGPFGVGYCTAKIDIDGTFSPKEPDLLQIIEERKRRKMDEIRKNESPYVKLARESLEHFIREKRPMNPLLDLSDELMNVKKGVFVTLNKDGMLRGCIGTIEPTEPSIGLEIMKNAVAAGTEDPRFDPVEEYELDDIIYSVDVLSAPEPIKSMEELDVEKYGVIVSLGYRRGLLLPNLEGIDIVEEQVSIALSKANIRPDEPYTMERFEVKRYN